MRTWPPRPEWLSADTHAAPWTLPIELTIDTTRVQAKLIEAGAECERLAATGEVGRHVEAARDVVIRAWNMVDATLSESDEEDEYGRGRDDVR